MKRFHFLKFKRTFVKIIILAMKLIRFFLVSSFFLLISFSNKIHAGMHSVPFLSNTSYYSFNAPSIENDKFTLFIQQGYLNIKFGKPQELLNGEVILYNLLGQEIIKKKLEVMPVNQVLLPLQGTCYIVRIIYSGKIYTQKIIVK